MKTIKNIFFIAIILIALPYVFLWDFSTKGFGKNSGHTAGLCEGFLMIGAFFSLLFQFAFLAIILTVYFLI